MAAEPSISVPDDTSAISARLRSERDRHRAPREAVDDRRGLPVASSDVEAYPASVEVAAQGKPRGALPGKILNINAFYAECSPVDPVAHERVVEGPFACRAVDGRQVGRDLGRPGDAHRAAALLPE